MAQKRLTRKLVDVIAEVEAQLKALMDSAGKSEDSSPSTNAMLYG